MSKAKRKSTTKTQASDHSPIIETCVRYACHVAAASAAFEADPCDMRYANVQSGKLWSAAKRDLISLAARKARTAEEIEAKARLVSISIRRTEDLIIDKTTLDFIASFAADVKAFTGPIIHEHWKAKNKIGKAVQS